MSGDTSYLVDGVSYPRYKNIIDKINKNNPLLLSNTPDAVKVREWLRINEKFSIEPDVGWLIHLANLSDINQVKKEYHDSELVEWQHKGSREQARKIEKINLHIDHLIFELSDGFPELMKAYNLFDSWEFFYSSSVVEAIHQHAAKTGRKPVLQENVIDLLQTLKKQVEANRTQVTKHNRVKVGDFAVRGYVESVAGYLLTRFFVRSMPNAVIAALVSLEFMGAPVASSDVYDYLRKNKTIKALKSKLLKNKNK